MHDFIRKYVEGCDTCQCTKPKRVSPAAPLIPNEIPTKPWKIISIDMISPLPESKGNNVILVIVDRFSKKIEGIPTTTELTSKGVAELFRDHVFKQHGLPQKVISDQGPQFVSHFMADLLALLGIKHNRSTAYHPQTDGQTERINQELEQYLRIFINERQDNWAEWLPLAVFSYNDKVHSATGYSPFFLNFGQHPWKGKESQVTVKSEPAKEFADRIKHIHEDAQSSLKAAAESMKRSYDKHRREAIDYKLGDKVPPYPETR